MKPTTKEQLRHAYRAGRIARRTRQPFHANPFRNYKHGTARIYFAPGVYRAWCTGWLDQRSDERSALNPAQFAPIHHGDGSQHVYERSAR